MQRAQVTRHIERDFQQTNFYTGYVELLNTTLHYTVSFPQGMDWFLEDDDEVAGVSEVREYCKITVRNGAQEVELEEREYLAFFQLIADFAISFEHAPQMVKSSSLVVRLATALGAKGTAVSHEVATLEADEEFFDIFKREKFRN